MRRRSPRVPFEDRHSRKRVPSTSPRLFALRFEPANQNCACPKVPQSFHLLGVHPAELVAAAVVRPLAHGEMLNDPRNGTTTREHREAW